MQIKRKRRSPVPTQAEVRASLRKTCSGRTCDKCIHFQDESEDLQGWARCWCSSAEITVTWRPECHTCRFWHNGSEVKKRIAAELEFAKMSIDAWLKKHKKK